MMRTMTAIQMISDGNGDNEIRNDDDSDSNDKDRVYTGQSFDLITAHREIDGPPQG